MLSLSSLPFMGQATCASVFSSVFFLVCQPGSGYQIKFGFMLCPERPCTFEFFHPSIHSFIHSSIHPFIHSFMAWVRVPSANQAWLCVVLNVHVHTVLQLAGRSAEQSIGDGTATPRVHLANLDLHSISVANAVRASDAQYEDWCELSLSQAVFMAEIVTLHCKTWFSNCIVTQFCISANPQPLRIPRGMLGSHLAKQDACRSEMWLYMWVASIAKVTCFVWQPDCSPSADAQAWRWRSE